MKSIKKIFSILLTVTVLLVAVFTYTASAASCTVSASSASGKQGDTVTVNIDISKVALGAFTINASFDSSKLSCVSYSVGSAGNVLKYKSDNLKGSTISYNGTTDDVKNSNVEGTVLSIKFKILAASGSAVISVSGVAYEADYSQVSVSTKNGTVNIISSGGSTPTNPPATQKPTEAPAQKSSDAFLKSLTVKGVMDLGYLTAVSLSPSFSSGTFSYKASIAGDVQKLAITAVTNNANAKVSIPAGYLRMDAGSNVTKITVTAEDGTKRVYTIYTEKAKSGTSVTEPVTDEFYTQALTEPLVEATTETDTETQININESAAQSEQQTGNGTSADVKNQSKLSRNSMYIKLGAVFGAAAVLGLIISVVLFIKEGKKYKGDRQ